MHLFAIIGSATVVAAFTLLLPPAQSGQHANSVEPHPRSARSDPGIVSAGMNRAYMLSVPRHL